MGGRFEPKNRLQLQGAATLVNSFWPDEFPVLSREAVLRDEISHRRHPDWDKVTTVGEFSIGTPVKGAVCLPTLTKISGKIECFIPKERDQNTIQFLAGIVLDKPVTYLGAAVGRVYLPLERLEFPSPKEHNRSS